MGRLSWNLGASNSWNPHGLSRPVMELLYIWISIYNFILSAQIILPSCLHPAVTHAMLPPFPNRTTLLFQLIWDYRTSLLGQALLQFIEFDILFRSLTIFLKKKFLSTYVIIQTCIMLQALPWRIIFNNRLKIKEKHIHRNTAHSYKALTEITSRLEKESWEPRTIPPAFRFVGWQQETNTPGHRLLGIWEYWLWFGIFEARVNVTVTNSRLKLLYIIKFLTHNFIPPRPPSPRSTSGSCWVTWNLHSICK